MKKTFLQYLTESKNDYKFRLIFSGKPVENIDEIIKKELAGYDVISLGKMKSQPIEKSNPAFPNETNPEIYTMELTCTYPVTSDQIHSAITNGTVDKNKLVVQNLEFSQSEYTRQEKEAGKADGKALLDSDYDDKFDSDTVYGSDYNSRLVKNSVSGSAKMKFKDAANAETTNDLKQGVKSPIGSTKNKMPVVKSNKR